MEKLAPSYVAGLFDGEGYFTDGRARVSKRYTVREYRFQPRALLTIRELSIVKALNFTFGGNISKVKPRKPEHAVTWCWQITGSDLDSFLKSITPYLRVKLKAAKIMQAFRQLKRSTKNAPISDRSYAAQCKLHEKLKKFNAKGVSKQ